MVLDAERRLALVNDAAADLLDVHARDTGRLFSDLELSYRPVELRGHLDTAIDRARARCGCAGWWRRAAGDDSGDPRRAGWSRCYEDDALLGVSLQFHDVSRYQRLQDELEQANRALETAYEELQSTNEELETTNEELQSTVEELETTNEELQSTNEELETMNEELQSMNDELQSMNDELRERSMALDDANGFMTTVLSSLHTGVAVLDRDLRVQAWNSRAEDLWGVRSDETVGRHLLSLDIGLPLDAAAPGAEPGARRRRRDGRAAAPGRGGRARGGGPPRPAHDGAGDQRAAAHPGRRRGRAAHRDGPAVARSGAVRPGAGALGARCPRGLVPSGRGARGGGCPRGEVPAGAGALGARCPRGLVPWGLVPGGWRT